MHFRRVVNCRNQGIERAATIMSDEARKDLFRMIGVLCHDRIMQRRRCGLVG